MSIKKYTKKLENAGIIPSYSIKLVEFHNLGQVALTAVLILVMCFKKS